MLLHLLREKLTELARWIRALTDRFARRSQLAEGRSSRTSASVESAVARPPASLIVAATERAASSVTEDAVAHSFEREVGAAGDAGPDRSEGRGAELVDAETDHSGAQPVSFQPADDAVEADAVDQERAGQARETPASEEPRPHEARSDVPSDPQPAPEAAELVAGDPDMAAVAPRGTDCVPKVLHREPEFLASGAGDEVDLADAANTDRSAPTVAAQVPSAPAEYAPEDQGGVVGATRDRAGGLAEDKAGQPMPPPGDLAHEVDGLPVGENERDVHRVHDKTDAGGTPADHGEGAPIADAVAGIDADLPPGPQDGGEAQAGDGRELDERAVDRAPHPRQRQPSERRGARIDTENRDRPVPVSGLPIEDVDYLLWNRALARHCLLGDEGDAVLYLTITPTILAAALSELQPGRLLPEDAEAAFVRSVTAVYHGRVLGHRQRLRLLRRCGPDGLPDCIAFLAGSVLAAYQMRSDEETAATAYYARLADLLECDLAGGHPRGFDPDEFEALWRFLETWLRTEKGRRLAMPGQMGLRRFVALPLTHVPLRRVDIERLPEFFAWAGYEPGARIDRSKLDQDLGSWSLGRSSFTNAGMAALADERREAVLAQITRELESWDGSHMDSLGRRSGRVEILLDIVQRRPELFYLPRRPAAFPQVFDDGVHGFEASDEGWYDPVPIRGEDGPDLAEGFEWQVVTGRLRLVLHRSGARAIALPASHEYTGYLSRTTLQLGAPCAALCCEALAEPAAEYLSAISRQRCIPLNHPGLPDGWRLFTGIKPQRRGEAPPTGLEALAVEAGVDLIPTGGLRLGSRWAWLAGAPPRLIVAGLEVGEPVTIDGEPVAVAEDGMVAGEGYLARPGTHVIEAAGLRRRIEIMEPEVRCRSREPVPRRTAVALPRGSWTLVGALPGEVTVPALQSRAGAVASCTFPAVWAVEATGVPDARVICILTEPPSPGRVLRFATCGPVSRSLQTWASAIYNAAIRRPDISTLYGQTCPPAVRSAWVEYAQAARDIKRRFRRARR